MTDIPITLPGRLAPGVALHFADPAGAAVQVSQAAPMPVTLAAVATTGTPAAPLAESSGSAIKVGPFLPVTRRPLVLSLSGTLDRYGEAAAQCRRWDHAAAVEPGGACLGPSIQAMFASRPGKKANLQQPSICRSRPHPGRSPTGWHNRMGMDILARGLAATARSRRHDSVTTGLAGTGNDQPANQAAVS